MIPRIAHFHWEGKPINWLRMASIHTFAKLNPRWEIRLLRTPDWMREMSLPSHAHEADWTWLEAVHDHGGFAMATDTVFVKPIPEEWLDAELTGCSNGSDTFYHCCFGAVPELHFIDDCLEVCYGVRRKKADSDYQAYGINVLKAVCAGIGGMRRLKETYRFFDMPRNAITPVEWHSPPRCWTPEPFELPEETIGVTWFGNHPASREREWDVPKKHADAAIVKLARQVIDA